MKKTPQVKPADIQAVIETFTTEEQIMAMAISSLTLEKGLMFSALHSQYIRMMESLRPIIDHYLLQNRDEATDLS